MADQEVLIEIKVDTDKAKQDVTTLTKAIEGNKNATKELETENKRLAQSGKQNSQQYRQNAEAIALNKNELSQLNAQRKRAISTAQAQKGSLQGLRNELAKLTSARNNDQVVGSKAFNQSNRDIAQLNKQIKASEQAGGDFRRNVGNYSSATDGLTKSVSAVSPAIGGMATQLVSATRAAIAFIATPIGAILAAVAAAIGLVAQYFTRTEDGGNKLALTMAYLGGIFEGVLDVLSALGHIIVDQVIGAFEQGAITFEILAATFEKGILNIQLAYENLFGTEEEALKLTKELEENAKRLTKAELELQLSILKSNAELDANVKALTESAGAVNEKANKLQRLQGLENSLNKLRRESTVITAEANRQVFEGLKIAKDETISFAERRKGLEEASAAEKLLSDQKVEIARRDLEIIKGRDAVNNSTTEALQEVADAEAALIDAQTASLRVQTKIQASKITLINQEKSANNAARKEKEDAAAKEIKDAEDLLTRTRESQHNLTIAKKEAAAEEIEGAQEKAFALTEIEKLKLAEQLNDETLLTADIELLKFESGERIAQFRENAALQEQDRRDKAIAETEKNAKKEEQLQKQVAQQKINLLNSGFALAKAVAGDNEKLQKGIAIAQAVTNTALGITKAFATLPYPAAIPAAASIAITGAAQLATIASQSSDGGGGSITAPTGTSVTGETQTVDTNQIDQAADQQQALENAIANLGLTVSVSEINDVQNSVSVSEDNSQI
jgi:hypothetical protein